MTDKHIAAIGGSANSQVNNTGLQYPNSIDAIQGMQAPTNGPDCNTPAWNATRKTFNWGEASEGVQTQLYPANGADGSLYHPTSPVYHPPNSI